MYSGEYCKSCSPGYKLIDNHRGGKICVPYQATCSNGNVVDTPTKDGEQCKSCNTGYKLDNAKCIAYQATCANGSPVDTPTSDGEQCKSCNTGYKLDNAKCVAYQTTCTNGTVVDTPTKDGEECKSCDVGFKLQNNACVAFQASCSNGTVVDTPTKDGEECKSCDAGYKLQNGTCVVYQATCSNGTVVDTPSKDGEECKSCDAGYKLDNGTCVKEEETETPYSLQTSGRCKSYILGAPKCFSFSNYKGIYGEEGPSKGWNKDSAPFGCVEYQGNVFFNELTQQNRTNDCGADSVNCACDIDIKILSNQESSCDTYTTAPISVWDCQNLPNYDGIYGDEGSSKGWSKSSVPEGCIEYNGKVFWNNNKSGKACGSGDLNCYCYTSDPFFRLESHTSKASGQCEISIPESVCKRHVNYDGLYGETGKSRTWNNAKASYGCIEYQGDIFWNDNKTGLACGSDSMKCACKQ